MRRPPLKAVTLMLRKEVCPSAFPAGGTTLAKQKFCAFCGVAFTPNPRTEHQISCTKPACRKKRKQQANATWRRNNPGGFDERRAKVCQWAEAYPDYWRKSRASRPKYRQREKERMRLRRARVAKQDAIRRDPVGYLQGLRGVGFVAKQDAIARLDGIVDYLQFLAVAKPNDIDPATPVPLSSLP